MGQDNQLHASVRAAVSGLENKYKVHDHAEFATAISSPADFAKALGYPVERVAKTLFLCSQDKRVFAAAVVPASRRLDFKSAAGAVGVKRVQAASAEDLQARTGYPGNGVSPLGLAADIAVVVDSQLLDYPTVLIGGGAAAVEIEISPADLVRISAAAVQSITTGDNRAALQ
jgi:Cys-tRNA(Pro)/Cys-tRNA(Cys) deacylase